MNSTVKIKIIPWLHNSKSIIHKSVINYLQNTKLKYIFVEGNSLNKNKILQQLQQMENDNFNHPTREQYNQKCNKLLAIKQIADLKIKFKIPLDDKSMLKTITAMKDMSSNISIKNYCVLRNLSLERTKKWVEIADNYYYLKKIVLIVGIAHCIDLKKEFFNKSYKNIEIKSDIFGKYENSVREHISKWDNFWSLKKISEIKEEWHKLSNVFFNNLL